MRFFNIVRDSPMLFSQPVTGITGMDTPGITNCTVSNGGFYVCNNSVEDMQYPSYSTGNGRDVVWEGECSAQPSLSAACHFRSYVRKAYLLRVRWKEGGKRDERALLALRPGWSQWRTRAGWRAGGRIRC
jgi:hypothetical protein